MVASSGVKTEPIGIISGWTLAGNGNPVAGGPCRSPVFRDAAVVTCAVHGRVKLTGLSAGRSPWPVVCVPERFVAVVLCESRGRVTLVGLFGGRIPSPGDMLG